MFLTAFGLLWWIPAATTATVYSYRADDDALSEEGTRKAVWIMSWVNVALFAVLTVDGLLEVRSAAARKPVFIPRSMPPPHAYAASSGPAAGVVELPVAGSSYYPPSNYEQSHSGVYGGYPMATEPPSMRPAP